MSERRFDIIFDGSVINGANLEDVKHNVRSIFKLGDGELNRLFSGQPVTIKKNLDRQTATRYQTAMTQAGARIQICLHQGNATDKTDLSAEQVSQADNATGMQLMPVGSDLLKPEERVAVASIQLDLSHLSLEIESDPPGTADFSVADSQPGVAEDQAASYPSNDHIQLNTNLDIAAVGATLSTAEQEVDAVVVSTDHLQALAAGTALIDDQEMSSGTVELNALQILENSQLVLAEAGADLLNENEKPRQETASVDTSELSLVSE